MTATDVETTNAMRTSWRPLIVVVLTQIQASFAVNALTVSMAGITEDLPIDPVDEAEALA